MRLRAIFYGMCLLVNVAFAQQRPHYSQYVQNMSVINPAYTGVYKGFNIYAGFRNQWQGVESAPKTTYLTFSSPVSFGGDMANYRASDMGVEDPYTKDDKLDYTASMAHHAFGMAFISDETGPIKRITGNITYAYHLEISDITNLSVGMGLGVNRVGLDVQKLKFEEADDPVVANSSEINKFTPDLNFGIYLYSSAFYFGASMQQILPNKLKFSSADNIGKEVSHYFITTGFRFFFNDDFSATPSVMLKYVRPLPAAYDLNLKIAYRNNFWIGGSYRQKDAIAAMFGFNVSKTVNIGYAYDSTLSEIKTISSGTHEIVLGVRFLNGR